MLIRHRYLVRRKHIDVATEHFHLARLCMGYLSLDGFDLRLSDANLLDYANQGYYAFFDYALAYWAFHLEMSIKALADDAEKLQEIGDIADTFIRLHWHDSDSKLTVPKSLQESFK